MSVSLQIKLILDASLHASSTTTSSPSIFAIWCWFDIRLPQSSRALNTIFSPLPLGVM